MKHILKYKLHGNEIPWYVEEGLLQLDGWYYGVSKDDEKCHIPSDIIKVSKADLKTELGKIEFKKTDKTYTKQEKDDYIDLILNGKV